MTRPDITFVVHTLSQFLSAPRSSHLQAAHHLLRYLKDEHGIRLFFSTTSSLQLCAFSPSLDYVPSLVSLSCPGSLGSNTQSYDPLRKPNIGPLLPPQVRLHGQKKIGFFSRNIVEKSVIGQHRRYIGKR